MLRSMTAYGRSTAVSKIGRVVVEIQSVNRKFLEIHLNMPKELRRFEIDVRKWLAEDILCGQIYVNITARFNELSPVMVAPNLALAKGLHQGWQQIAQELQLDFDKEFSLDLLTRVEGLFLYDEDVEHDEDYRSLIHEGISGALKKIVEMRIKEGTALLKDLKERMAHLEDIIEKIAVKVVEAPKKYREKLVKLLEEVLPGCVENEDRLLREAVIYSERIDVSEEITRFRSHLEQFKHLLEGEGKGIGKAFDFITQELGREINTLGTKSPDIEVSHLVVEAKTELAKIREQMQNIE